MPSLTDAVIDLQLQYEKIPAGPKLNVMMAHIMGWVYEHDGLGNMAWYSENPLICTDYGDGGVCGHQYKPWNPSVSIEKAMILEEYVLSHTSFDHFCLDDYGLDPGLRYRAGFGATKWPNSKWPPYEGYLITGHADTAALAICRAVLLAMNLPD